MIGPLLVDNFSKSIDITKTISKPINDKASDEEITAFHEAGHLYYHIIFEMYTEYVTILKKNSDPGIYTDKIFKVDTSFNRLSEVQQRIIYQKMTIAGLIAEVKVTGIYVYYHIQQDLTNLYYNTNFYPKGNEWQKIWAQAVELFDQNETWMRVNIISKNLINLKEVTGWENIRNLIYENAQKTPRPMSEPGGNKEDYKQN